MGLLMRGAAGEGVGGFRKNCGNSPAVLEQELFGEESCDC